MQLAALTLPLLLAAISAYVGCMSYQRVMSSLGVTVELPTAAYTSAALVAASNPLATIYAAVMLPVSSGFCCSICLPLQLYKIAQSHICNPPLSLLY